MSAAAAAGGSASCARSSASTARRPRPGSTSPSRRAACPSLISAGRRAGPYAREGSASAGGGPYRLRPSCDPRARDRPAYRQRQQRSGSRSRRPSAPYSAHTIQTAQSWGGDQAGESVCGSPVRSTSADRRCSRLGPFAKTASVNGGGPPAYCRAGSNFRGARKASCRISFERTVARSCNRRECFASADMDLPSRLPSAERGVWRDVAICCRARASRDRRPFAQNSTHLSGGGSVVL